MRDFFLLWMVELEALLLLSPHLTPFGPRASADEADFVHKYCNTYVTIHCTSSNLNGEKVG